MPMVFSVRLDGTPEELPLPYHALRPGEAAEIEACRALGGGLAPLRGGRFPGEGGGAAHQRFVAGSWVSATGRARVAQSWAGGTGREHSRAGGTYMFAAVRGTDLLLSSRPQPIGEHRPCGT